MVVALLDVCDVTTNGRHHSHHVGLYPRIIIQVNTSINGSFCAWHVKSHINKHFASFHLQALLLLLNEVDKTCIFTQKWLDHLLTYDVISGKRSNWPSLNLSQNVREGWTNSYWKQEKAQINLREGGDTTPPPPSYVRGVLNEFINRRRILYF